MNRTPLRAALLLGAALLPLPGPAAAQWSPATACDSRPSTPEMQGCLQRALDASDRALNESYRRALLGIDRAADTEPADRTAWHAALVRAQRAWVAFRDADCGEPVGYEWSHGTGAGPATMACQLEKTEARRRELDSRYKPG